MEIAFGLDNDADAGETFRFNFPEAEFLLADISELPDSAVDQSVDLSAGHPLLFNACAPCQPFSRQGHGAAAPDDGRLQLLDHLLRFVHRHRPEVTLRGERARSARRRSRPGNFHSFRPDPALPRLFHEPPSRAVAGLWSATAKGAARTVG